MISSKFNLIFGAAIFASTVYFLWIKIKRKSVSNNKDKEFNNDEVKDHKFDENKLEDNNVTSENSLNADNVANVLETDINENELLSGNCNHSINFLRENCYDNDEIENIVILDNLINNNYDLSVQQIDDIYETSDHKDFQIIETSIKKEYNTHEQFLINDNNTLKFNENNEIEKDEITFSDNLEKSNVENQTKNDNDTINMELNTRELVENVLTNKENTQNFEVFDEIKDNEILENKFSSANETKCSLIDNVNIIIPNVANEVTMDLDTEDSTSGAVFDIETGKSMENSFLKEEEEETLSSLVDTSNEKTSSVSDETVNEIGDPLDIENENVEILTENNNIENCDLSQIEDEIAKIEYNNKEKEITKSEEEIDSSETGQLLVDNERENEPERVSEEINIDKQGKSLESNEIDEEINEFINNLKIGREIATEAEETAKESAIEQSAININQLEGDVINDRQIEIKADFPISQDADLSSDISQNSDYIDDSLLTNYFMEYVEECLNENESKHGEIDESNSKIENWPNDDDSLNDIKRDFYEMNNMMICSPHPSSESDHAHCVNNLTERVAILSAESILDNQCQISSSSDSELTPTLHSPILSNSNPELYVEKITCGGKELDVVYFEEALLEEGGVHPDVKIIRTIPVGLGGRIIGKKGKTKNELMKKYGAQLLIYNHPMENGKQVLEITCSPSVRSQLESWVNKTLDQITKNTLQTTVSNPEWLKPMIPLGKLVAAHIVDMPTIQHIKLRIFDPEIIKEFNRMQIEMNIDYSNVDNTALLPRPVAVGCVCVAMIRPDYFLRAQIVDIYEDIAWVYLFDLGKVCQTYLYYLFKIREKYMRVPFQIIPARIPNATIKNNNITPDVIFKRFLCNPSTLNPIMVRVFFPRMHTCCEPCVNVYIPVSSVSKTENNEEFIDLLELLVSIGLCSMSKISVNATTQSEINSSHVKAFLNEKAAKASQNLTVPMYFQPCNSKFYEDYIEFKSESDNS